MTRVLVIEDDANSREVIRALLGELGYEVRTAANGADGLHSLHAWRPDVILLDLFMPDMDGWEFRREQEGMGELATIPVVLLSAAADLRAHGRALEAAAVVEKPVDIRSLARTVEAVVGQGKPTG